MVKWEERAIRTFAFSASRILGPRSCMRERMGSGHIGV